MLLNQLVFYQDIDDEVLYEAHHLLKLVGISAKAQQYIGYLSTGENNELMLLHEL